MTSHSSNSSPSPNQGKKIPRHSGGAFNPRKPSSILAAVALTGILYFYSVKSIQAAKHNAKLHREADGGQVDMRKESLRRHGRLDRVEGTSVGELFRNSNSNSGTLIEKGESENAGSQITGFGPEVAGEGSGSGFGRKEEDGEKERERTDVERGLGRYKGLGGVDKIKGSRDIEKQTSS